MGFSKDEAHSVIESSWRDTPENMRIKTTGNLKQIFSQLKVRRANIKYFSQLLIDEPPIKYSIANFNASMTQTDIRGHP